MSVHGGGGGGYNVEGTSPVEVEPCPDDLFTCLDGGCALQAWTCDGDNDCEDGSDEVGCRTYRIAYLLIVLSRRS